ncbi:MAG: RICIN domain-containing protein [Coriobacteriia bacterium]|nr:RICIN domain-containing protein [Coriobacteriia bacterium]
MFAAILLAGPTYALANENVDAPSNGAAASPAIVAQSDDVAQSIHDDVDAMTSQDADNASVSPIESSGDELDDLGSVSSESSDDESSEDDSADETETAPVNGGEDTPDPEPASNDDSGEPGAIEPSLESDPAIAPEGADNALEDVAINGDESADTANAHGGGEPETLIAAISDDPIAAPTQQAAKASPRKITSVKSENAVFTGKALTPKLVVKSGSQALKLGRDYTVTYKRNVKAGKATVIVKGIGAYTGVKKTKFRIFKKPELTLGATKMPVNALSTWIIKYAKMKLISGKSIKVKGKGKKKTVVALKTGKSKLAIYNLVGKRIKLKTVEVYKFYGAIYLKIGTSAALYLDATDNGRVKLSAKRNIASQQFLMEPQGTSAYRITNSGTGMSLRAAYESGTYTSKIIQAKPSGAKANKWRVYVDSKNRYSLVNVATGKAIGVAEGNDKADVKPSLKKASLVDARLFKPKALPVKCVTGATAMPLSSTSEWNIVNCKVIFRSGKDVAKLKDNTMTALKKGKASIRIVNTMGKILAEQELRVYKLSGEYYLSSSVSPGRVVDIDAWLTENGGNIILWDSTGLVNQKYNFNRKSDGTYRIKSVYSGNYLQVSENAETPNNVEQWQGTSNDRQRWYITVDSSNLLTFVNKATGQAMALEGASTKRGTSIVCEDVSNAGSQKFYAVDLNQKVMKGKYDVLSVYACRYSYSQPLFYQYKKSNMGTAVYKSVCGAIFPGYVQMSCDRGVATAARWSGVDIDYPAGTPAQYKYLMKSSDWKYLGHWSGKISDLKPGDVLIRVTSMKDKYPNTKQNHTCVYVGNATALAVYNSYIRGTDGDLGAPTSDACFVSAHRSRDNKKNASAACIGNASFAHADSRMVVFRCVNANNSIKYSYLS